VNLSATSSSFNSNARFDNSFSRFADFFFWRDWAFMMVFFSRNIDNECYLEGLKGMRPRRSSTAYPMGFQHLKKIFCWLNLFTSLAWFFELWAIISNILDHEYE